MKKTEKLLIDITFNMLYKKGYTATSITDILKEAGLTKGAMYFHFKSKEILVLETVKHHIDTYINETWINPLSDGMELSTVLNMFSVKFHDKSNYLNVKNGCPLTNFIAGMSDKDDIGREISEYLWEAVWRWEAAVEKWLDGVDFKSYDINLKKEATFIVSQIMGAATSSKASGDINRLDMMVDRIKQYVEEL